MSKGSAYTLLFLTAGLLLSGASQAQSNPYQLKLPGDADYRLVTESPGNIRLASKPYAREIEQAARLNRLDPALVHALIHVESRHQANARSPKGAIGLMQVLPETAARFGVNDAEKVERNLTAGTSYLRSLLDLFDQRLDLALAAYNAGEGAVMRYNNTIPPYPETRDYVPAVLKKYEEWRTSKNKRIAYQAGTWMANSPPDTMEEKIPLEQNFTQE